MKDFTGLADYAFAPHYLQVDDTEGGSLRVHYLDEGAAGCRSGAVDAWRTQLVVSLTGI